MIRPSNHCCDIGEFIAICTIRSQNEKYTKWRMCEKCFTKFKESYSEKDLNITADWIVLIKRP